MPIKENKTLARHFYTRFSRNPLHDLRARTLMPIRSTTERLVAASSIRRRGHRLPNDEPAFG